MAATTLVETPRTKTMLIYRQDGGVTLTRFDLRAKQKTEMALTMDELRAIAERWPDWQRFLSNAGAPNVGREIASPSASMASPEPGNSPSLPLGEPAK